MSLIQFLNKFISQIENFLKQKFVRTNAELIFVLVLIGFPILIRLTPFFLVSSVFVVGFLLYVLDHFYLYTNRIARIQNKQTNTTEYSWGFVKTENTNFDIKNFYNYLKTQDIQFFKNYLLENSTRLVFVVFLFVDLLVAFKNLPLNDSGAYFAISIFTKFVFIAFVYIVRNNRELIIAAENKDVLETRILDNFYKHFNGLASISLFLFAFFFTFGKEIVEIFFGLNYLQYQTSLSFILLANLSLLLGLLIFRTALELDKTRTWQVTKIHLSFFTILFIFLNISHPDTVAFFVMGATAALSIFLYNLCIRKPAYIERTYTALF